MFDFGAIDAGIRTRLKLITMKYILRILRISNEEHWPLLGGSCFGEPPPLKL